MNKFWVSSLLLFSSLAALTDKEAEDIGVDAYIYAYPLVTMDLTKQVTTNISIPEGLKAPVNQFANAKTYPNANFHDVTAPNADTLYSSAWLDLTKEPIILHIPDEGTRYFLFPILSAWTDVIASPGTRVGTKSGDFAITGPNFKGVLPQGVTEIKSPTNMAWILGRTYSSGTQADYAAVHALQSKYTLTPLSFYGKTYTPPRGNVNRNVDTKTPVRDQVNKMSVEAYFKRFAELLKENPPSVEDLPMVQNLAKIGIVPGKDFDPTAVPASQLRNVAKLAQQKILEQLKVLQKNINGWDFITGTGNYGTNYLARAFITYVGLGANLPQDAIYPSTHVDSTGAPLNGKNKYVIHFNKGELPPAKGFWSLTMYNDQYYFVSNPINKYSVSERNNLKKNEDGSVDLYIQHDSPGQDKESNWLPAPQGNFVLMMRLYWPDVSVIDGSWKPPAVKLVK